MLLLADEIPESGEQSSAEISHPRSSVRYVRKDLKTYLTNYSFLKSDQLKARLLDISSGGVQAVAAKKIRVNKRLTVNICFSDGYKFELKGKIVRVTVKHSYVYELKYETLDSYINKQNSTFSRVYMMIGGRFLKTKYRNITSDSIQILADGKIDKKQNIRLVFQFSNGKTIERIAKVSRVKQITEYQYGIKFESKNQLLTFGAS